LTGIDWGSVGVSKLLASIDWGSVGVSELAVKGIAVKAIVQDEGWGG
jgi:hypothetical protein